MCRPASQRSLVAKCFEVNDPSSRRPLSVRIKLSCVAIVLIVLWALGLVTSYTLGGFIHILIVVAVIIVLVQFIQGRR